MRELLGPDDVRDLVTDHLGRDGRHLEADIALVEDAGSVTLESLLELAEWNITKAPAGLQA